MINWILGEPGGPAGPFWSIISSEGEVIALQIPSRSMTERIIADHQKNLDDKIMAQEIKMAYEEYISKEDIVEELRLRADSMSTHKALADKIGISEQFLCDILKGKRNPGVKVCQFLKVEPVLVYREVKE